MKRILLVEDDLNIQQSLKEYLSKEGFSVTAVSNLQSARAELNGGFQLLILDWMLPDGQGLDFLKAIRSEGHKIPVIMLTARTDLIDRVLGLESGAGDYVMKPFEPRELLARVRVQLREAPSASAEMSGGGIKLNTRDRQATFQGKPLELTRKEFDLLVLLLAHPNKVFSREELLNKVWGFENFPTTRTVDTHVLQLRQKTREDLIETVRGVGYRMKIDEELSWT